MSFKENIPFKKESLSKKIIHMLDFIRFSKKEKQKKGAFFFSDKIKIGALLIYGVVPFLRPAPCAAAVPPGVSAAFVEIQAVHLNTEPICADLKLNRQKENTVALYNSLNPASVAVLNSENTYDVVKMDDQKLNPVAEFNTEPLREDLNFNRQKSNSVLKLKTKNVNPVLELTYKKPIQLSQKGLKEPTYNYSKSLAAAENILKPEYPYWLLPWLCSASSAGKVVSTLTKEETKQIFKKPLVNNPQTGVGVEEMKTTILTEEQKKQLFNNLQDVETIKKFLGKGKLSIRRVSPHTAREDGNLMSSGYRFLTPTSRVDDKKNSASPPPKETELAQISNRRTRILSFLNNCQSVVTGSRFLESLLSGDLSIAFLFGFVNKEKFIARINKYQDGKARIESFSVLTPDVSSKVGKKSDAHLVDKGPVTGTFSGRKRNDDIPTGSLTEEKKEFLKLLKEVLKFFKYNTTKYSNQEIVDTFLKVRDSLYTSIPAELHLVQSLLAFFLSGDKADYDAMIGQISELKYCDAATRRRVDAVSRAGEALLYDLPGLSLDELKKLEHEVQTITPEVSYSLVLNYKDKDFKDWSLRVVRKSKYKASAEEKKNQPEFAVADFFALPSTTNEPATTDETADLGLILFQLDIIKVNSSFLPLRPNKKKVRNLNNLDNFSATLAALTWNPENPETVLPWELPNDNSENPENPENPDTILPWELPNDLALSEDFSLLSLNFPNKWESSEKRDQATMVLALRAAASFFGIASAIYLFLSNLI